MQVFTTFVSGSAKVMILPAFYLAFDGIGEISACQRSEWLLCVKEKNDLREDKLTT